MKTAIESFTKAIGAAASATAPAREAPAASPPLPASASPATPASDAPSASGYDQIRIPAADGSTRQLTKAEFEGLPLGERVGLLMGGKLQFFRQGKPVSAREALKGR